mmetsp:Transcript_17853/g.26582  ORF Transcript_17853/g.26582 Transcript_17853/m.26582 type:complete len:337 (-) Transcript_17853:109-1119(-)
MSSDDDFSESIWDLDDVFEVSPEVLSTLKQKLKGTKRKAKEMVIENQSFRDKFSFTLGCFNIFTTGLLLGYSTQFLSYWYTFKAFFMLSLRLYLYRKQNYHYFLFDFCYFANLLLLIWVWFFPTDHRLFLICFAFSNGPLALAVPLWKNALVMHSLDKLTSLFIHVAPMMTMYSFRWLAQAKDETWFEAGGYATCSDDGSSDCTFSLGTLLIYTFPVYVLWQFLYWFRVEYWAKEKVEQRDYLTSKRYMLKKGFLGTIIRRYPALKPYATVLFMLFQLAYTLITLLPTVLLFHSQVAHTIFILVICLWSAYNGGKFYIDVLAATSQQQKISQNNKD